MFDALRGFSADGRAATPVVPQQPQQTYVSYGPLHLPPSFMLFFTRVWRDRERNERT